MTLCQHWLRGLKTPLALNFPLPTQQKHTGFWRQAIQQEASFSQFRPEMLTGMKRAAEAPLRG
ncbi:hypothetical protein XB02_18965 [Pantoea ananatis]|nr:hypothetical protein XB02_18965 [Pantoea ananatis]